MVQQVSFRECRHPRPGAEGVPPGARRRLRGIQPHLPRQCLVGLFQGPEGNQIEMFAHAVVRARQPFGFKIDLDKSEDDPFHETEGPAAGTARVQADGGMWRAEISKEDRGEARSVTPISFEPPRTTNQHCQEDLQ